MRRPYTPAELRELAGRSRSTSFVGQAVAALNYAADALEAANAALIAETQQFTRAALGGTDDRRSAEARGKLDALLGDRRAKLKAEDLGAPALNEGAPDPRANDMKFGRRKLKDVRPDHMNRDESIPKDGADETGNE